MCEKKIEYIDFSEFVNISGMKETTIKRNYKQIPGITKAGKDFIVISGTRYPYNLRRTKVDDFGSKMYTLLKAISTYKYISHKELRLEHRQFEKMLEDLLSANLIENNNLSNIYGANAYDCTIKGFEVLKQKEKRAKEEIVNMISSVSGMFTGAVLSQIFDVA